MPLHRYVPIRPPCKLCGDGFDHATTSGAAALTACPRCGLPVQRAAAESVQAPKLSSRSTVSRAKDTGFTLLKRTSDGHFEKQ